MTLNNCIIITITQPNPYSMIVEVQPYEGGKTILLSNEVVNVGANSYHVPQIDILEAFQKCEFQTTNQVYIWLMRMRDAHKGMSRSFLIRVMLKQHTNHAS